jgi:thiamine monophosphate synthase
VCYRHSIPLIINDRVDIALAVGAGVHLGQDDMPVEIARKLLPPGTIVGLSCNTVEQTRKAVVDGLVDYVGIGSSSVFSDQAATHGIDVGPIYETPTKKQTKEKMLGPRKAAKLVEILHDSDIRAVAIGKHPVGRVEALVSCKHRRHQDYERLASSVGRGISGAPCAGRPRSCERDNGIHRAKAGRREACQYHPLIQARS